MQGVKFIDTLVGLDHAMAVLHLRRLRMQRSDRDRDVYLGLIERTEGKAAREMAQRVWDEEAQQRAAREA